MGKFKLAIYLFCMMAFAGCSGQKQTATGQKEQTDKQWVLGPFVRPEGVNPVISPRMTTFQCPMRKQLVKWEESDTFNPAATVKGRGQFRPRYWEKNIPHRLCGKFRWNNNDKRRPASVVPCRRYI